MILKTKNNIPLTLEEQKQMYSAAGSIRFNIPFDITIIRNSGLSAENNHPMAMFSMMHPHTIFICGDETDWSRLIPKIGHELTHLNDLYKYGFLRYCFMVLPGIRECYLEPQAYAYEDYLKQCFAFNIYSNSVNAFRLKKKSIENMRF